MRPLHAQVHPDNFLRAMSMAGIDKFLNAAELKVRRKANSAVR